MTLLPTNISCLTYTFLHSPLSIHLRFYNYDHYYYHNYNYNYPLSTSALFRHPTLAAYYAVSL